MYIYICADIDVTWYFIKSDSYQVRCVSIGQPDSPNQRRDARRCSDTICPHEAATHGRRDKHYQRLADVTRDMYLICFVW